MREHCTLTKSEMSGFEEAKTLVAIEDDVVQQSNAEDITSCLHLRGDLHISGARFRAGCRLVVGHDHGGGAICQRVGEQCAWVQGGRVDV